MKTKLGGTCFLCCPHHCHHAAVREVPQCHPRPPKRAPIVHAVPNEKHRLSTDVLSLRVSLEVGAGARFAGLQRGTNNFADTCASQINTHLRFWPPVWDLCSITSKLSMLLCQGRPTLFNKRICKLHLDLQGDVGRTVLQLLTYYFLECRHLLAVD